VYTPAVFDMKTCESSVASLSGICKEGWDGISCLDILDILAGLFIWMVHEI